MIKRIEPYQPDHLDLMIFNDGTRAAIGMYGLEQFKKMVGVGGPAMTGFVGNKPVCIAGISIMWGGVGDAWALMAHGFEDHAFFIHRNVVRFMNKIIIEHGLGRVQAVALRNHEKAVRWLERLGFDNEGLMRKYFNGHDYWRFARIV